MAATAPAAPAARAKLSYREVRELEELPQRIEALEAEQRQLAADMENPELFRGDPSRAAQASARWAEIEEALMGCLERWEALSARA